MNIGFFTDTYYPHLNGVTISVDNFAKELRKKGHTVYIFAPKTKKKGKKEEDLTNLPSLKILSAEPEVYMPLPTSYKDYAKIFRLELDLIHAHGNGAFSLLGYQVARMKRIPFLLTFHTLHPHYSHYFLNGRVIKPRMIETALRLFANLCDAVLTPSEKMKKELVRYGVKKPIHVIPNFVEKDELTKIKKNYLHKKLGLPANAPLLLSVGRLGKEKSFNFVIETFHELAKTKNESHLVIVGQGTESKNLKQLVNDLGLTDRVHFTGKINKKDMPSVYADATIFVFASVSEVHPLVALEACAAGLPIIVAKDAAFANVVMDKKNGFLLPLQKKRFVEKIQLLLKDDNLRAKMGKESKEIIDKNFPPELLTDMLLKVYNNTLKNYDKTGRLIRINNAARLRLRRTTQLLDRLFN